MPQLQIVNRPPTFSEQLGQGLASGFGAGLSETLQQGVGRYFERKQKQAQLQDLLQNLGINTQQPSASSQLALPLEREVFQSDPFASHLSDEQLFALNAIDSQAGAAAIQLKKMGTKEKAEKYKATQELRSKINQDYKEAQGVKARLLRMRELNKSGKLTSPAAAHLLEKAGIPLGVLNNPESEEFDKLSKDLLKGISSYFPGRINIVEVENFLKSIPTLMNSEAGRERVIDNLISLLEPQEKAYKYKNEILKKSGSPPYDLEDQITQRLEKDLEGLVSNLASEERVKVVSPDGKTGTIRKADLEKAKKKGYKPL